MASLNQFEGRTTFNDLTKTTSPSGVTNSNVGGSTTSNVHPPPVDPREHRRQRDRDQYARMSIQQKEELLKKRRENYQGKKAATTNVTVEHHQLLEREIARNNENIASEEKNDWLHRNEMHQRHNLGKRPLQGNDSLITGIEETNYPNQLQGDFTLPYREICAQEIIMDCTHNPNILEKCDRDIMHHASTSLEQRQGLTDEQMESRRAKDRKRYANMTLKQRQAIRDRQNARDMMSGQKEAKRNRDKARRALRRSTLSKESIAIINICYNSMEDSP